MPDSSQELFELMFDHLSYFVLLAYSIITAWSTCFAINFFECITTLSVPDLINCNTCTQSPPSPTPHCSLSFGRNSAMVNKQEGVCDNNLYGLCMW